MLENCLEVDGKTHKGLIRATNEDALFLCHRSKIFNICDGMGGNAGGEVASQYASLSIVSKLNFLLKDSQSNSAKLILAAIERSFLATNQEIYNLGTYQPRLKGMATTASLVKIKGNTGFFGHVGDGRIYLLRKQMLYQLSQDHSLAGELVRLGKITHKEAKKLGIQNVVTRCLGIDQNEIIDTFCLPLLEGDSLLLCTDGLYQFVEEEQIRQNLLLPVCNATKNLIDIANHNGGKDNITAVVIHFNS